MELADAVLVDEALADAEAELLAVAALDGDALDELEPEPEIVNDGEEELEALEAAVLLAEIVWVLDPEALEEPVEDPETDATESATIAAAPPPPSAGAEEGPARTRAAAPSSEEAAAAGDLKKTSQIARSSTPSTSTQPSPSPTPSLRPPTPSPPQRAKVTPIASSSWQSCERRCSGAKLEAGPFLPTRPTASASAGS